MITHLTIKSKNVKTGNIPVSTSPSYTCPDACPLKGNGCYAAGGPLGMHWAKVSMGERGQTWKGFLDSVASFPEGQAWRHNQAGDLPGYNNLIDGKMLRELTVAQSGKRGWTYTHKPMTAGNAKAVKAANEGGFTVNLSADNAKEADELHSLGIAPVVVVVPRGTAPVSYTPEGRRAGRLSSVRRSKRTV